MKEFKILTIFSMIVFVAAFGIIGMIYVNNTKVLLDIGTARQLTEVAIQGKRQLTNKMEQNILLLQELAYHINQNNYSMPEKLQQLRQEAKRNGLVRISYADLAGRAVGTDGQEFYIGDREYFKKAKQGEVSVVEILTDRTFADGNNPDGMIVVTTVPVFDAAGQVSAVLFSTMFAEVLANEVQISFFDGQGYFVVVNDKGEIVFHPQAEYLGKNFFNYLTDVSYLDWLDFQHDVEGQPYGVKKVKIMDAECYIGSAGLSKESGNWHFFAIVPAKTVFGEAEAVICHTIYITAALILVFIALFGYILKTKIKNDQDIETMAFIDNLTGIRNYNKFCADGKAILQNRRNRQYALLYFDIDNFKVINDNFGYAFGDRLLIMLAETLKKLFVKKEVFGRLANDYFAILLPCQHDESEAAAVAKQVDKIFAEICLAENISAVVILSFGICFIQPNENDINQVLNKANMAKGLVKGHNHSLYAFFDETIRTALVENNLLENDIKTALSEQQFRLYYQPQFSLHSECMISAEALIRWQHPTKGFISPALFIPVAEKNDLIVGIGRFVFEQTCRDLQDWRERGLPLVSIAVNFSIVELYQKDLLDFVRTTMEKYEIPQGLIEVEITETAMLNDLELTLKMIAEFKAMGIAVLLDDFGTGYSSLAYLKSMPIDVLKLDRSFIWDIEADVRGKNIAKAIVVLAQSLRLKTIAEGVETKEQLEFVKMIGCDMVQGFYFAKPLPKAEFEKFIGQAKLEND